MCRWGREGTGEGGSGALGLAHGGVHGQDEALGAELAELGFLVLLQDGEAVEDPFGVGAVEVFALTRILDRAWPLPPRPLVGAALVLS